MLAGLRRALSKDHIADMCFVVKLATYRAKSAKTSLYIASYSRRRGTLWRLSTVPQKCSSIKLSN